MPPTAIDTRAKRFDIVVPTGYAKPFIFAVWDQLVLSPDGTVDQGESTPKDTSGWSWTVLFDGEEINSTGGDGTVSTTFAAITDRHRHDWALIATVGGVEIPFLDGTVIASTSGGSDVNAAATVTVNLEADTTVNVVHIGGGGTGGGGPVAALLVSILDADGNFTATTVEGALAELAERPDGLQTINGKTGTTITLVPADIGAETAGAAAAAIAAHLAASDPHPQYLTQTEGDARYEPGGSVASEAAARAAADSAEAAARAAAVSAEATARSNADAAEALARDAAIAAAIADLIASAPGALDTLKELADAIGDDPNYAATVTNLIAGRQPLDTDLTAIAALATTAFGRGFLTLVDAAAARTALALGTAAVLDVPATGNAAAGEVVKGSDGRLTDARTPTAHHTSHESGGTDPLTLAMSQITGLVTALAGKVDVGGVRFWDATTGNLTGLASDRLIIQTGTLTSGGAIYFLPDASTVPGNTPIVIADISNTVDDVNVLTVATAPGSGDTIPGAASYGVSFVGITNPLGVRQFRAVDANTWVAVDLAVTTDPDLPGGDATLATCAAVSTAITNAVAALPDIGDTGYMISTNLAAGVLTINVTVGTDFESSVRITSLDQMAPARGNINAGHNKVIQVADPTLDDDAATKRYVDARSKVTTVSDANYTALASDRLIEYTSLTATRTVTLPAANSVPNGWTVEVADASGNVSATVGIFIQRAGSDTMPGGITTTTTILSGPYDRTRFTSDGVSKWYATFQEVAKNKAIATDLGGTGATDLAYPSQKAVKTYVDRLNSVRVLSSDANATIASTDRYVFWTATMTTNRTLTLPLANSVPAGWQLKIVEASGTVDVAGGKTLTVTLAGSDTMPGSFASSTFINANYSEVILVSDGSSVWYQIPNQSIKDRETSTLTSGSQHKYPSTNAVLTGTGTLTNKRITKRVTTLGDGRVATITPPGDTADLYRVGAVNGINQAVTIAAPSGTPTDGDRLVLELKFDGTSRAVTWNSIYIAQSGLTLPNPVADTKWRRIEFEYDSTRAKWVAISITTEA